VAFQLRRGRGIGAEVKRLLDHHLAAAIECLDGADPDVPVARRHVKKASALLQLARPALGDDFAAANRRLRKVNHLLGTITDAEVSVKTLQLLRGYDFTRLPSPAFSALNTALRLRATRIRAESPAIAARAVRLLSRQRHEIRERSFRRCGLHSVAETLRQAHKHARTVRDLALRRPSATVFHAWRRRTKLEWFLFRLVSDAVGGRLVDDERRLEVLDGCLGELHNLAVLQEYLRSESPLTRSQTAAVLRVTRAVAGDLKRRARWRADTQDEPPRELESRVMALWRSGVPLPDETGEAASWPIPA
jgi:hypothetical protein